MIPEILSAFLMVFLSFGGFADARRDTHLRVQQHITMHDGIYSKCEHWFGSGKTCEECIKSKGGFWGFRVQCVWSPTKGCNKQTKPPKTKGDGWAIVGADCSQVRSKGNWNKGVKPVARMLKADRKEVKGKLLAPVDDSMEPYNKRITFTQKEAWGLTGNNGYCWRASAAQAMGMPYLVFEQMVKTMQLHLNTLKNQGWVATNFKYLRMPLSFVLQDWKNREHKKYESAGGRGHGGDENKLFKELRRFRFYFPDVKIYQRLEKGKNGLTDRQAREKNEAAKLAAARDKSKWSGVKKNQLDTPGDVGAAKENKGVQQMFTLLSSVKKAQEDADIIDGKLKTLIDLVQEEQMNKPTLERIKQFLAKDKRNRITLGMWWLKLGKTAGGHAANLLLHNGKLYYADGNGAKLDGEMVPFDKIGNTYSEFKTWLKNGNKKTGDSGMKFEVWQVSRRSSPRTIRFTGTPLWNENPFIKTKTPTGS